MLEQRQYIKYVSTTLAMELYIMGEGRQTKIVEIGGLEMLIRPRNKTVTY